MAAGAQTQGRRLPDAQMGVPGGGWDDWEKVDPETGRRSTVAPPGSYMKVFNDGDFWCWYIVDPSGVQASIRDHHTVVEHDDGTITATPSVVGLRGWHGFLERGVWREV